jgi:hypothetical protein
VLNEIDAISRLHGLLRIGLRHSRIIGIVAIVILQIVIIVERVGQRHGIGLIARVSGIGQFALQNTPKELFGFVVQLVVVDRR